MTDSCPRSRLTNYTRTISIINNNNNNNNNSMPAMSNECVTIDKVKDIKKETYIRIRLKDPFAKIRQYYKKDYLIKNVAQSF